MRPAVYGVQILPRDQKLHARSRVALGNIVGDFLSVESFHS